MANWGSGEAYRELQERIEPCFKDNKCGLSILRRMYFSNLIAAFRSPHGTSVFLPLILRPRLYGKAQSSTFLSTNTARTINILSISCETSEDTVNTIEKERGV